MTEAADELNNSASPKSTPGHHHQLGKSITKVVTNSTSQGHLGENVQNFHFGSNAVALGKGDFCDKDRIVSGPNVVFYKQTVDNSSKFSMNNLNLQQACDSLGIPPVSKTEGEENN